MKQKIIVVALTVSLLLGCLSGCVMKNTNDPIPAGEDIAFALGNVATSAGEEIVVPILVNADSNVAAVDFIVTYDSDVISYQSFSAGLAFKAGIADANEVTKGQIKITMATLTPPKDAGRMCELTFKVADAATPCEIPLTLDCVTCCDYDTNKLENTCQNGTITVK